MEKARKMRSLILLNTYVSKITKMISDIQRKSDGPDFCLSPSIVKKLGVVENKIRNTESEVLLEDSILSQKLMLLAKYLLQTKDAIHRWHESTTGTTPRLDTRISPGAQNDSFFQNCSDETKFSFIPLMSQLKRIAMLHKKESLVDELVEFGDSLSTLEKLSAVTLTKPEEIRVSKSPNRTSPIRPDCKKFIPEIESGSPNIFKFSPTALRGK